MSKRVIVYGTATEQALVRTIEELKQENAALRHALQSIADEAVNHHETNLVSGITRLPRGYRNILNIAAAAIDSARNEAQP